MGNPPDKPWKAFASASRVAVCVFNLVVFSFALRCGALLAHRYWPLHLSKFI